jgi:hypothetical protein
VPVRKGRISFEQKVGGGAEQDKYIDFVENPNLPPEAEIG